MRLLWKRQTGRSDLYLTTHNTHNRHPTIPPAGSNPKSQRASGLDPRPNSVDTVTSQIQFAVTNRTTFVQEKKLFRGRDYKVRRYVDYNGLIRTKQLQD